MCKKSNKHQNLASFYPEVEELRQRLSLKLRYPVEIVVRPIFSMDGSNLELFLNQVSSALNVSYDLMMSARRDREAVLARQLAMYFITRRTSLTPEQVGKIFNRDRTTVLHNTAQVVRLLDVGDPLMMDAFATVLAIARQHSYEDKVSNRMLLPDISNTIPPEHV
ncbi:MAG TPA: helix-turn-helix domain-containing protein [Phnomibacter sp.]|nr:helix-turn-helix domain-containing protein [Phnomibacter sp.]